jgi:tetratricopeptide (TPR) repeat protein
MQNTVKERLALARAHARRGEWSAAESAYEALLTEFPDFADVHHEVGLFFHERGDYARAQKELEQALKINPAYIEAALNLSILWNDLGRYEDASRVYQDANARAKGNTDKLDPPVAQRVVNLYAEIGDIYAQAGLWDSAVKSYREGLRIAPSYHDIRMRLAQVLLDAKELPAAIDELELVVRLSPELIAGWLTLGLAYLSLGDEAKAANAWQAVLKQSPDHPRAKAYLRLVEKS